MIIFIIKLLITCTCLFQCTEHLSESCLTSISALMTHSRATARKHYAASNTDTLTAKGHVALTEGLAAAAAEASGRQSPSSDSEPVPPTPMATPTSTPTYTPTPMHASTSTPSTSTAQAPLVCYGSSSDDELNEQLQSDTSKNSTLSLSTPKRKSGHFSVFSVEDHNYLGRTWSELLKKDVRVESKSSNRDIMKAVLEADRAQFLTSTYTRNQLTEKHKSLLKNFLRRKREKKPLSFDFRP